MGCLDLVVLIGLSLLQFWCGRMYERADVRMRIRRGERI